jgi:MerR family mercuric resistance operon transcriptional regulator
MNGRTIGKLAAEAGVNVETVRFYQRKGLLGRPRPPQIGWRQYSERDVTVIRYIKQAQQLGFSLAEVKSLASKLDEGKVFCEAFRQALTDKVREIDEEVRRLNSVKESLELALGQCRVRTEEGDCPIANNCGPSTAQVPFKV